MFIWLFHAFMKFLKNFLFLILCFDFVNNRLAGRPSSFITCVLLAFPDLFFFLTVVANVACAFLYCSIIGLYVSMVFVIGRFARLFVSEVSYRIMFMELPYIDKILKLCLDIYLVRECCDFRLEEDLFAKLLFLYRSPETMIRWTKMKRE